MPQKCVFWQFDRFMSCPCAVTNDNRGGLFFHFHEKRRGLSLGNSENSVTVSLEGEIW